MVVVFFAMALTFVVSLRLSQDEAEESGRSDPQLNSEAGQRFVRKGSDSGHENSTNTVQESSSGAGSANTVTTTKWDAEELRAKVASANVLMRNKALEDFKKQLLILHETDPELRALQSLLREIAADDEAFAPLVAASGAVGTPQVQLVLQRLVEERNGEWRTFSAVVPVLGGLSAPSDETLQLLNRLAREGDTDFSQTAALALGASVRGMAEVQPRRARQILESYIARLQDTRADAEDLKESLSVLGNSGLTEAAQPILVLTRHTRSDVRAEAVMALRFIRTPEVEKRLVEVFARDSETQVRLSAVESLLHAPLHDEVLPAAQRIVGDFKNEPRLLRERAIDLIMHLELPVSAKSDLRAWLLQMAAREQDKKLKGKLVSAANQLMP
ncbi:MAG: Lipoprotein amino terminal region [Pseudomonadota bacterium]